MLTVLIRAAERHAWIADLLTNPSEDEPTSKRRGLLSCVPFNTDLSTVENALPWQNTYLLRVSVQLIRQLLDRFDHISGAVDTSTTKIAAERARLSAHLGIRLSNVGRREEPLEATTEAVEVYRRLAGANPAAFEPDLAGGLWSFAWVRAAGQVELPEALDTADESVAIYARLVERLPQAFTGDLRGALVTLADVFKALGRHDEEAQVRDRIERLE
ncbi:MAG: hypothetical protein ACRDTG_32730 [Pseudonocardiaceae bacterium]